MKYQYRIVLYRFALEQTNLKEYITLYFDSETVEVSFKGLISNDNFSKGFFPILIKYYDGSFQHNYKIYSVIKIPISKDAEENKCISI